jgi:undecaprenyl-diphosphatase
LIIIAVLIWRSNALAWDLLWAVIITAVLVTILKGVFRRQRPKEKWAIATDKYSFPSGHAARAAALAVRLAYAWPNFILIWLLWAISVALARVILSRHYVSDVAGGLVTGILTGLSIQFFI